MSFCTNCGAQLGFGRFCTNCGAPVAPPADSTSPEADIDTTSVRLPRVQPDASSGPRFPLYAAPTDAVPAEAPAPSTDPVPAAYPMAAPTPTPAGGRRERRRSPWPWVAVVLLLLLGGAGGAWAVLRDSDDDNDARGADAPASTTPPTDEPTTPSPTPTESDGPSPTVPDEPQGKPVDLAAEAQVKAPRPTAPGQSVGGAKVSYPPTNMLDGDPATAYRIDGNAAGTTITFTFDSPVTIREIGMINGYAKTEGKGAKRRDWYASNRKVTLVEWAFDDGTVAEQKLRNTTDLQVMQVTATPTRTVRLTLVEVSEPGPDPRNTTAISSVLLRGHR